MSHIDTHTIHTRRATIVIMLNVFLGNLLSGMGAGHSCSNLILQKAPKYKMSIELLISTTIS